MRIPDGPHRIFEQLRACALREDWDAFAAVFAEATDGPDGRDPRRPTDGADAPVPSSSAEAETEANKALVRRYFDMWNTGAGMLADDVLGPTYVDHCHPDVIGPAASRSLAPRFHAANPDAKLIIEAILAEGEFVTVRNAIHRTQGGREVVSHGMAFFRVAGGKLAEQWSSYPRKPRK